MNRHRTALGASIFTFLVVVLNVLSWAADVPVGLDNLISWLKIPSFAFASPRVSVGLFTASVALYAYSRGSRGRYRREARLRQIHAALGVLSDARFAALKALESAVDAVKSRPGPATGHVDEFVVLGFAIERFTKSQWSLPSDAVLLNEFRFREDVLLPRLRHFTELAWLVGHIEDRAGLVTHGRFQLEKHRAEIHHHFVHVVRRADFASLYSIAERAAEKLPESSRRAIKR